MVSLVKCKKLVNGDEGAAALLYKIAYWTPRASVKKDGRKWIAKKRSEWIEQEGYTPNKLRRRLKVLVDMKHIETKQAFFGGRCILHVILTDEAQEALFSGEKPLTLASGKPLTHNSKIHTYSSPSEKTGNPPTPFNSGTDMIKKTSGMKMSDVAQQIMSTPLKPPKDKSSIGAKMAHAWRVAFAEMYGSALGVPTQAEVARFTQLSKIVGPENAVHVVDYVVRNWGLFCAKVKNDTGWKIQAGKPALGAVQKAANVAKEFALSKEAKGKAAEEKTPVQLIAKPKSKPAMSAKEIDEIAALLKED